MNYTKVLLTAKPKLEIKYQKSEGDEGIYETVDLLIQLKNKFKANGQIRNFTIKLLPKTGNDFDYAKSIYNFIKDNIRYISDVYKIETIQTPILTLLNKGGDCDDISLLASAMLESIGIKTNYVIASYSPDQSFSHIYIIVSFHDGKKLYFDGTAKKFIGYERPGFTRKEIL